MEHGWNFYPFNKLGPFFLFFLKRRDSVPKNRSLRKSFEVEQGSDEIKSRKSITSYHYRSCYERKIQGFIPVKTLVSLSLSFVIKNRIYRSFFPFLLLLFFFSKVKMFQHLPLCLMHSRLVQHCGYFLFYGDWCTRYELFQGNVKNEKEFFVWSIFVLPERDTRINVVVSMHNHFESCYIFHHFTIVFS